MLHLKKKKSKKKKNNEFLTRTKVPIISYSVFIFYSFIILFYSQRALTHNSSFYYINVDNPQLFLHDHDITLKYAQN